jgi:hypothetical protein
MSNDIKNILAKFNQLDEGQNAAQKSVPQLPALFKPKDISPVLTAKKDPEHPTKKFFVGGESVDDNVEEEKVKTSEDVISTVKKKLGDYLQDVASAIKKDPDLLDKLPSSFNSVGPAVKTITTDDGQEIKIHGNEDDGFRITVKNKPHSAKFKNLDHAVMACEMYCNQRRSADNNNNDYVEEKR